MDVIYDPADISELIIEYEGQKPFRTREMVIGERSSKRPKLPEHLNTLSILFPLAVLYLVFDRALQVALQP